MAFAQPTTLPRFEVASIKPSGPPQWPPRPDFQGVGTDRISASSVSVRRLISIGFHVYDHQIFGGPPWMDKDLFDIEAKAPRQANEREMEQMVQTLLADRFQLATHRETRQQPVLELVVAKDGPKLGQPIEGKRNNARPGQVTGRNAPVEFLAGMLTYMLGKTVVDKTGIEGKFSYDLKWTPDEPSGARDGVSLFAAIEEQLGLKLEARKGQVEVIVVDHVEKPSDN